MVKKINPILIIAIILGAYFVVKGNFFNQQAIVTSHMPIFCAGDYADLVDINLSMLSKQTYGNDYAANFNVLVSGYPNTVTYARGYKMLDKNVYKDYSNTAYPSNSLTLIVGVAYTQSGANYTPKYNLSIDLGEKVKLTFANNRQLDVYLPELKGDIRNYQGSAWVTLYIADDGSTYWDSAMTNLAGYKVEACANPQQFYGWVKIDNVNAPDNTKVDIKSGGNICTSQISTKNGQYGLEYVVYCCKTNNNFEFLINGISTKTVTYTEPYSSSIQVDLNLMTSCTPNWQCNAWTSCSGSLQTRTCSDTNNCGITTGKPIESQSCTMQCVPTTEICGDGIDQDCSGADLPCTTGNCAADQCTTYTGFTSFYAKYTSQQCTMNEYLTCVSTYKSTTGDTSVDGTIDNQELLSYISKWVSNGATNQQLLNVIGSWVNS
jgi:hypothetical protein